MSPTDRASVTCPGCRAECPLPEPAAAAMRIHCLGCHRRFDALRWQVDDGPFRGGSGFEVVETPPPPSPVLRDISGHPWLRRISMKRPTSAVTRLAVFMMAAILIGCSIAGAIASSAVLEYSLFGAVGLGLLALGVFVSRLWVEELGVHERDLIWSYGVGRFQIRRRIAARYVQEMIVPVPDNVDRTRYVSVSSFLAAHTSLGDHWPRVAANTSFSRTELEWLAAHITRGIELDKLKDEELAPGTSPAPDRPRRRSGRRR